jgi:hypothetical protein
MRYQRPNHKKEKRQELNFVVELFLLLSDWYSDEKQIQESLRGEETEESRAAVPVGQGQSHRQEPAGSAIQNF